MKKLTWAIVFIVLIIAAGYVGIVTFYSPENQRSALEQRLSHVFGRPAHVGSMRLSFRHGLSLQASDLRVDRDPSFGDGPVFEVGTASANVAIWDFVVHGRSAIGALELADVHVTLVKRSDGVWNWSALGSGARQARTDGARSGLPFALSSFAPALSSDPANIVPSAVRASGVAVTLVDLTTTPPTQADYRGLSLDTNIANENGAYHVNGKVGGDSAALGGEPLDADVAFELRLSPPDATPSWRGEGKILKGRLATRNVAIDSISTDVALDPKETLTFSNLALGLYGGTLAGEVALDLSNPKNAFSAKLQATSLDLARSLAPRKDLAEAIAGRASGTYSGSGALGDFNATLSSLDGDGQIAIDQGALLSVNLLSEIAKQGGFTRVTFDEAGTRADTIKATYHASGGRFAFTNASVAGINGYATVRGDSGWIELSSPATMHLEGAATLLPPLFDKIRAADPSTGPLIALIAGRPGFALPLTLDGPMNKPSVSVHWRSVAGLPF